MYSSGVQAKRYFGSMYEPILFCVKDKNNYTFNADEIKLLVSHVEKYQNMA